MNYIVQMDGLIPGGGQVVIPDWMAEMIRKQAHAGDPKMIAVRDRMFYSGTLADPNEMAQRAHALVKEARRARLLALVDPPLDEGLGPAPTVR